MLFLVLLLVLIAFGLLIAALITSVTLYAWTSLAVSVLAAGVLVLDWRSRRRRARQAAALPQRTTTAGTTTAGTTTAGTTTAGTTTAGTSGEPPDAAGERRGPAEDEPAEEGADAADLLIVAELDDEVRVVNEHPRYHLAGCGWLAGRPTLPLRVAEARELGFTGCARCAPDATLAAAHRR